MHYRHKWEIFDALKPSFASCEVSYEMPKVPITVKNKVIKFLKQGYSSVNRGDSGILYDALCSEFEIPTVKLLNRGKYTQLCVYQENEELEQKAIEFSKADCAVHIMHLSNNPPTERWGETLESFREMISHRESNCLVRSVYGGAREGFSMEVKQLRKTQELLDLATHYSKQEGYNDRIQGALDLLNSNGSLVFTYKAA
jgi:hypothetical protein